jgi:hypothetical protein
MDYTAKDFVDFIQNGRMDKVSQDGLRIIASEFKKLEGIKEAMEKKIKEIKEDERMSYKIATVFENSPLALIQMGEIAKLNIMEDLLGEKRSSIPVYPERFGN